VTGFLIETLVWTGALIALTLLIRRPVAQWFGATAAYALWLLPMARLLLPPLVLPSWMAPAQDRAPLADAAAPITGSEAAIVPASFGSAAVESVPSPVSVDWTIVLIAIWLGGVAIFLVRRYGLYFRMRRDLLAGARPVGRAGAIRLVETRGADGPVAFGVLDKVVALPTGFMANRDIEARDLALAHELAHHRGHDLLCNMLVQPLFALHWFNPLSIMGWQALRRDQEAACDARVVGAASRERRAAYAAVIARFATRIPASPQLALAAPMACPVLADGSSVNGFRSIAMPDRSKRGRWAGRMILAAGALALPLTGSISYAQSDAPPPPEPPAAPSAPAAPRPVAAPLPPAPPAPPSGAAEDTMRHRIVRIERHVAEDEVDSADESREVRRGISRHSDGMSAEERAVFDRETAEMHAELAKEKAELNRELERELGKDGKVRREMRIATADARHAGPRVRVECRDGQDEVTESVKGKDGREELWICQAAAFAEARRGLAEARAELRSDRDMHAKARAEALRAIDRAEASLRAD